MLEQKFGRDVVDGRGLDFGFWILNFWILIFGTQVKVSAQPKVLGLWTLGFGSWPLGYGLCVTPDFGFRIFELQIFGFELWTLTFGLWILDFGFWNSGQGFRIAQSPKSLAFGLWTLRFRF